VATCAGCGTVQNFTEGWHGRTEPYGGVDIVRDRFREADDVKTALFFPFWTSDLALSAIGDTLALPVTLPIAFTNAMCDSIRDYYFPKDRAPEQQPPPDDPPSHQPTERIHGGIQ
jgi:uncharacterized protein YceK